MENAQRGAAVVWRQNLMIGGTRRIQNRFWMAWHCCWGKYWRHKNKNTRCKKERAQKEKHKCFNTRSCTPKTKVYRLEISCMFLLKLKLYIKLKYMNVPGYVIVGLLYMYVMYVYWHANGFAVHLLYMCVHVHTWISSGNCARTLQATCKHHNVHNVILY